MAEQDDDKLATLINNLKADLKADLKAEINNLKADMDTKFASIDTKLATLNDKLSIYADQVAILRTYSHADVARRGYAVDPFPVGPSGTQMIEPGSRYRKVPFYSR